MSMSKRSEREENLKFCYRQIILSMSSVCLSCTSNSYLSFEARGLKFCKKTPHINPKKVNMVILKLCPGVVIWGFLNGQTNVCAMLVPYHFTQTEEMLIVIF